MNMTFDEIEKETGIELRLPDSDVVIHKGTYSRYDGDRYVEIVKTSDDGDQFMVHADYYGLDVYVKDNEEWILVDVTQS